MSSQDNKAKSDSAMPEVTFSTFVLSLASSALVQMGEVPNPETGAIEKNVLLARHTIDILNMLQEKITQGLTAQETQLFKDVLYELRMKFVVHS